MTDRTQSYPPHWIDREGGLPIKADPTGPGNIVPRDRQSDQEMGVGVANKTV